MSEVTSSAANSLAQADQEELRAAVGELFMVFKRKYGHRWREQFGLPQPEYVKIDVDGHEVPLIDGATQGLGACRQLLIEIEDAKMDLLTHRLGELGLTIASKHPVQNYAGLWNCIFVR